MKFDLSSLSAQELSALISAAEKRKSALSRRRSVSVVRADLIVLAASLGYTIGELFGTAVALPATKRKTSKRRRAKVAVKYRDPENRRNTWTGRGSQPRWLREKARRGMSVADFLITGLAKPTANTKSIGKRSAFKRTVD